MAVICTFQPKVWWNIEWSMYLTTTYSLLPPDVHKTPQIFIVVLLLFMRNRHNNQHPRTVQTTQKHPLNSSDIHPHPASTSVHPLTPTHTSIIANECLVTPPDTNTDSLPNNSPCWLHTPTRTRSTPCWDLFAPSTWYGAESAVGHCVGTCTLQELCSLWWRAVGGRWAERQREGAPGQVVISRMWGCLRGVLPGAERP